MQLRHLFLKLLNLNAFNFSDTKVIYKHTYITNYMYLQYRVAKVQCLVEPVQSWNWRLHDGQRGLPFFHTVAEGGGQVRVQSTQSSRQYLEHIRHHTCNYHSLHLTQIKDVYTCTYTRAINSFIFVTTQIVWLYAPRPEHSIYMYMYVWGTNFSHQKQWSTVGIPGCMHCS